MYIYTFPKLTTPFFLHSLPSQLKQITNKIQSIALIIFPLLLAIGYLIYKTFCKVNHSLVQPSGNDLLVDDNKDEEFAEAFLLPSGAKVWQADPSLPPPAAKEKSALINVPDDGNCLFYALAVGLRKKYSNYPGIQKKLDWDIDPNELKGSLYKSAELLKGPGKKLRKEAATYLEQNFFEEQVSLAIFEGRESYLEYAKKKLNEEEALAAILFADIDQLSQRKPQTKITQEQTAQKQQQLNATLCSITFGRENMPEEGDQSSYINLTKRDKVYCGIAQLLAISKEYNIPIRVLYQYGKPGQTEQIFNQEVEQNTPSPLPILTIAHVNNNHFQFLDD